MIHNIQPEIYNLHGRFSRERKPIVTIDSGDTILAGTRFCSWGIEPPARPDIRPPVTKIEDRADPINDVGNCLIGPVAVKGAKPGMTLQIDIEDMKVGSYGITMTGGSDNKRYARVGIGNESVWMPWVIDRDAGTATNLTGQTVKLRPFLGCLGNCPDLPGYVNNMAPREVGGNMDCKDLVPGTTLYLPVAVPEALFSFGDGHAVQGDGETGDSAIECPMENVRLTLTLRDDMPIKWPMAKTPDSWLTFGFADNLDEATYIAVNGMLDLMTEKLGVTRADAFMLSGLIVDLRITEIVNPTVGVHAVWRDDALV